jgi:hypothetical protein
VLKLRIYEAKECSEVVSTDTNKNYVGWFFVQNKTSVICNILVYILATLSSTMPFQNLGL